MYYSKSTQGFYDPQINSFIPDDAVEITKEEHQALLQGQSNGLIIKGDSEGVPCLEEPPPPTDEQIQEQENAKNKAYLASTDWYVVRKAETGVDVPDDVLSQRQAARDAIV